MNTVQEKNTQIFTIDPIHTNVGFSVRHLMIAKVRGHFKAVAGTIAIPPGSDVPEAVDVTIEGTSIDTREPQRDDHLRSPDFLDVATHPTLRFASTSISGSPDAFEIHGDMTIHGTTRPVVLHATFEGRVTDPWGNLRAGYEANTTISRKDFGLTWNQVLEAGGVAVGDEVRIELNVEAIAPK
ncbi:MAG: YceI family protein [Candidatus Cybelea sp.]|jgi:polyisoprenoid-binding protein YceI